MIRPTPLAGSFDPNDGEKLQGTTYILARVAKHGASQVLPGILLQGLSMHDGI